MNNQRARRQAVDQIQTVKQRVPAVSAVVYGGGDIDVERVADGRGEQHFHITGAYDACQSFTAEGTAGRE